MSPFYYFALSLSLLLTRVFHRVGTYKICQGDKIREELNAFFSLWLAPCGVGFDAIPSVSPSVFDVQHKADSTLRCTDDGSAVKLNLN